MIKLGVSYYGNRIPWHVKEDMQDIKRHNCNFVVHTFSETDLEYYSGTMKEIVALSHGEGIEVWLDPWAVGKVFGGESYSDFLVKNFDARQVSNVGDPLPIACVNNKKFKNFMFEWTKRAIECKADVLFWDEPHMHFFPVSALASEHPVAWACRCKSCQYLFKEKYKKEMSIDWDEEIKNFFLDSIRTFVKDLCDYAKKEKKDIKNATCFLPFENYMVNFKDWEMLSDIKTLDIIGTDPYWQPGNNRQYVYERLKKYSRIVLDIAKKLNKEAQVWILNFNIKKGEEPLIETAVNAAYEEGIRNLAAWSYYGAGYFSLFPSEDPKLVWDTLGKAYGKLLQKESKVK